MSRSHQAPELHASIAVRYPPGASLSRLADLRRHSDRAHCRAPWHAEITELKVTESGEQFDIYCNVSGGGKSSQAGAIRLGISRALCEANPAHRAVLKGYGLLTRDARKVERKKYGQPGARKKFQFSKR